MPPNLDQPIDDQNINGLSYVKQSRIKSIILITSSFSNHNFYQRKTSK